MRVGESSSVSGGGSPFIPLVPYTFRDLVYTLAITPSYTPTVQAQNLTTTGTKASPQDTMLSYCRGGFEDTELIDGVIWFVEPGWSGGNGVALGAFTAAIKMRFALVQCDGWGEESTTVKGLPNGNLLASTGLGLDLETARDNWSSINNGAQACFFPFSGGSIRVPKGTPVALFVMSEVARTNAGATGGPDVPDTNIFNYNNAGMPACRGDRFSGSGDRFIGRPSLFRYDLITGGIDNISWTGNVVGSGAVAIPIINHLGYTDNQIHGTTHWSHGPSVTMPTASSSVTTVNGTKTIAGAQVYGTYAFRRA